MAPLVTEVPLPLVAAVGYRCQVTQRHADLASQPWLNEPREPFTSSASEIAATYFLGVVVRSGGRLFRSQLLPGRVAACVVVGQFSTVPPRAFLESLRI